LARDNLAGGDDRVDIHTGPEGYDVDALSNGLQEHYYAEWPMLASEVEESPGRYVLPGAPERLPLLFTLKASKPRAR